MASTIFCISSLSRLAPPIVSSSVFGNNGGHSPSSFLSFPLLSTGNIASKSSRLRICHRKIPSKHFLGVRRVSCLVGDDSGINSGSGKCTVWSDSPVEATIDIQLPRRCLLVKLTCNSCGMRSEKLVNRLAYEQGTVFVQVVPNITN